MIRIKKKRFWVTQTAFNCGYNIYIEREREPIRVRGELVQVITDIMADYIGGGEEDASTMINDFSLFDIDFITEEDKDELLKNTKLQMRYYGVGHCGYNQSIIKSALQKGVRRNQHNLVAWCLRETFLFYTLRNKFSAQSKISAKQFNTNIINRLHTIAVEDCSPRAIIATNACVRNLKLYSKKDGDGDPKYLMRAGFCLSTCQSSRVCSHLRYLCGGEGEIFFELARREREIEEEEGKRKISITQRLQIIFNVLVNDKIKRIDNDYNNENEKIRDNNLQLLLKSRRVICAYHTLKIYHQLANMDDCGNSLLIGNNNQKEREQQDTVKEKDGERGKSYQSLMKKNNFFFNNNNDNIDKDNHDNICATAMSKIKEKKNCGGTSVAIDNKVTIKPPSGVRKKNLFSPFWEMCRKVIINSVSETNHQDITIKYKTDLLYALEWRQNFFASKNYFKDENLLLLSTIELLIAIIHGPANEFDCIQREALLLQQRFDKSFFDKKGKFNWLLNHKTIDPMPDYVMDKHTFPLKISTSFALEGSLVINGDKRWTPNDWHLTYTHARLTKEEEEIRRRLQRGNKNKKNNNNNNEKRRDMIDNWQSFIDAKLSVKRQAVKIYGAYYTATASIATAAQESSSFLFSSTLPSNNNNNNNNNIKPSLLPSVISSSSSSASLFSHRPSSSTFYFSSSFIDKCKKRKRLPPTEDDNNNNNNDDDYKEITATAKAKRIKYVNKVKKINDSGDFIKKNFSTLPKIKSRDVDRVVAVFNNISKKPFVAILKMITPSSTTTSLNFSPNGHSSFFDNSLIVIKHMKQSLGYGAHQSFVQKLKDDRICGFKNLHPLPDSGKYRGLMTGRFDIAPTSNPFDAKIVEISHEKPCNIYFVTGCVTQNGGEVCDTRLSHCRSSRCRSKTIINNKQNFLELIDIIAFRTLLGVNDTNHSNILVGEGGKLYSVDENKVGSMTSEMTMDTVKFRFLEKNLRRYNKNRKNEYCGPELIKSHLPPCLFLEDPRRKMMNDVKAIGQKYGISKEVLERVETNSHTTGPLLMKLFSTF